MISLTGYIYKYNVKYDTHRTSQNYYNWDLNVEQVI